MTTQTNTLLDLTLAASRRDEQMATPDGRLVRRLTHGVQIRSLPTITDQRGSVCELFDPRWAWHPDPQTGAADRVLRLRFGLPPGAYATALIRELIEVGGQLPSGVDTPD